LTGLLRLLELVRDPVEPLLDGGELFGADDGPAVEPRRREGGVDDRRRVRLGQRFGPRPGLDRETEGGREHEDEGAAGTKANHAVPSVPSVARADRGHPEAGAQKATAPRTTPEGGTGRGRERARTIATARIQ
jgi:hypothetical protein